MKKIINKIIIIIVFILMTLSSFTFIMSMKKIYIKDIYTIDEFNKITAGIVYFGRPTCPSCQIFKKKLNEILTEQNTKVFYFNTDHFKEAKFYNNEIGEYENVY